MSLIERKKKICVVCGYPKVIFSHGKCQTCYKQAVAIKSIAKLRLITKKKARPRKLPNRRMASVQALTGGIVSQPTLFKKLWDDNKNENGRWYCYFTGEDITQYAPPNNLWMNCCMHILPKSKFTYWKFHIENMRLAHPEFHSLCDSGSQKNRDNSRFPKYSFDMFYSLQEQLKLDYNTFKAIHGLP
jgi:hypothetical protein